MSEDEATDLPVDEDETANETDETERPADDNINEDTTTTDQSTDSTIITDALVNEYKSIIQNYGSLIDYYDFLIQDHLGMILPDENVTDLPVEGDDSAEVPAQDEDVTEAAC